MSDDVIRHAKRDYVCHDCSRTIHARDLYFNRYKDFTVLCMECYSNRRERWKALRDMSGRRKQLLDDLRDRPWAAADLHEKYGSAYIKLVRSLQMSGFPVGRHRVGPSVYYFLDEK